MLKRALNTVAIATCLMALAVPATAAVIGTGPLGQQWTATSSGQDPYGMGNTLTIGANTLSYNFNHPSPAWSGVPTQTYVFATEAANGGQLKLNIDLSSFASWYMAHTEMYIWEGSTNSRTLLAGNTWGGVHSTTATLDLTRGEAWGFMAVGGNYDGTGALYGSFNVTSDVPEPASLGLLALGLIGLGFARRKNA